MTSVRETSAGAGPAFGLWYDFRNPVPDRPFGSFYAEVFDQISWAEQKGLDSAWLTEHHFCDDGYSPSPFVLASAIAQRTSRMRIGTNLIVSPLHDPVRLAEDSATLSLLSGGRFDLGVGQGYWGREFEAFGRKITQRPSLLEEGIEVIRQAWSGSAAGYQGRRYRLPPLPVTPVPETAPQLLVGAMADVAIERAARIGDGFLSTQNAHHRSYLDALERLGRPAADARIYAGQWAIVAEDPERVWSRIGRHALYQLNEYISWGAFGPPDEVPRFTDPAQIVEAGAYQLMDAEMAVTHLSELLAGTPQIRDVHFWAMLPGEPVDSGSERIAYLADKVVPAVRERLRS
ncbi:MULTISPECIES: LLM class flavin-dependent oxidoreductase [Pseudonocardia]|uniref:Alkanal monooxygenase alpha chain n=2 Tax=Pseudonocardia TaxID=1847 RepID=A0A1Y2N5T7_PSEAH|nr:MULTISPECIES: LLM class flavin-dependent oxidoreductase [Pseudonocardia]OSY42830.1 Alkanal monooxygenase alpha chain [Pseudonocardia autotrophica]TDN77407.1 alkanesulfonate monooxygenase SsuD/methylene tetrahydromethanopterin reductase-like flavin-dependent oxidoreductase (luciferase family) [Pseudonocardia autotrophica]BBG01431.1 monooxygenase [Pseudonocardia autotrophica]GEC24488.1 monooxygenase [Pseudonocardia saturnea]